MWVSSNDWVHYNKDWNSPNVKSKLQGCKCLMTESTTTRIETSPVVFISCAVPSLMTESTTTRIETSNEFHRPRLNLACLMTESTTTRIETHYYLITNVAVTIV